MFYLLSKYIVYSYNDSSLGFLSKIFNFRGQGELLRGTSVANLGNINVDFFSSMLVEFLSGYFDFVTVSNIFVLISLFSSIFFSCKFFKSLGMSRLFYLSISFLYFLSVYSIFRVISATLPLCFTFVFPLVLYLLVKKICSLYVGIIVFLSLMVSNYYGYFLFIVVCLWYIFDSVLLKRINLKFLSNLFTFIMVIAVGVSVFFGPVLLKNFPIFGHYSRPDELISKEIKFFSVYRPIEDWYNLSFRPWYFFIPPKTSLFFGDLSNNLHNKISSTGYYLTQNYMEEEMAGSYMGWHFLLGTGFVATLLLLQKYKHKEFPVFKSVYANKEMILRSFFIIFCILLISGPPSFTINGLEIYTPSYLLYYIVPVFRTLVRWAVVIYLFVLIINSYLVQDLYNLMKKTWQKVAFILGFLGLNFIIFAIRIPVINVSKPPQEIAFVKEAFPESVKYAVYPKGDYYSIFWIISHEDRLINPTDFVDYETGFNADEFSEALLTPEGIQALLEEDPSYLIFYADKTDLEDASVKYSWVDGIESIVIFFKENFGKLIYEKDNIFIFAH